MKLLRLLWVVLLPASLLLSCDHRLDDPSPLGQFRLARVEFRQPNSLIRARIQRYDLTYNAEGDLDTYRFTEYQRTGPNQYEYLQRSTYRITRDNQRRVDRVTTTGSVIATNVKYLYNSSGTLYQIMYSVPTLDKDGVIIGEEEAVSYTFAYTGSSITPISRSNTTTGYMRKNAPEAYVYENGNAVVINNTSYTYDDKPNPYYGLLGFNTFLSLFNNPQLWGNSQAYDNSVEFGDVQVKLFNRNNITNNTKQITYNADGLVTRIEYTNGNIEEFTYERKP